MPPKARKSVPPPAARPKTSVWEGLKKAADGVFKAITEQKKELRGLEEGDANRKRDELRVTSSDADEPAGGGKVPPATGGGASTPADRSEVDSVFGDDAGAEAKDIFETDFELPAIDNSQADALEDGDTDLDSPDFDLAVDMEALDEDDLSAGAASPPPPPAAAAPCSPPACRPTPPAASPPAPAQPDKPSIEQVTTDHSLARALLEAKTISAEEAADHRFRNILWKYLGSKEVGDGPEVRELSLAPGDRLLLCTDGLSGAVADDRLLDFVQSQTDVQQCAERLGQFALVAGSRDNVSCIVVEAVKKGAVAVGTCSLVGNYRENNEDAVEVKQLSDWTVCLVADGMGGHAAGEIASKRAIEVVVRGLRQHLPGARSSDQVREVIRAAVVQANHEIIAMGSLDRDLKNMGTTLVLAACRKGGPVMFVTNVGDSRCYLIRKSGAPAAATRPSVLPAAYADRAVRLADDLTHQLPPDAAARLLRLGVLAVKLAELVDDLRSVGVPDAQVLPLAQMVASLKALVARSDVPADEIGQAVQNGERVLRAFADQGEAVAVPRPVAAASKTREAFWK